MFRIKLPGKENNKKILLFILVVIALIIIFNQFKLNKENRDISNTNKDETIISDSIKESNDNEKIQDETIEDSLNVKDKVKTEDENEYSSKENELYSQAYELFFNHDYNGAINKADYIINEYPSNAMAYNIRGIAQAYNGDFDNGIKDIDKALSIDDKYGYAMFNKALTYELYGKMDEALEWYNKALNIEEYEWSYYGIASIYGRKGDVKNTVLYLNKAINMDQSIKEVAKTEHDFDPVKDSEEFKRAIYD